jgi:hypothetical protein
MKDKLINHNIINNKELYKINPKKLKKIIYNCYCDNVTLKQHTKLFKELGYLLEFYKYTKINKNFQPYIIIDK